VLLSDGLWRRRFGADPTVVGRTVRDLRRSATIIGVMPPSLAPLISAHFYQPAEIWAPVGYARQSRMPAAIVSISRPSDAFDPV
jgi:putative ABC transport system permease protein